MQSVFPSRVGSHEGRFDFGKEGDLKRELFIPVYKTGYSSSFLHKNSQFYIIIK